LKHASEFQFCKYLIVIPLTTFVPQCISRERPGSERYCRLRTDETKFWLHWDVTVWVCSVYVMLMWMGILCRTGSLAPWINCGC
jgi:hypothetical protein